MVILVDKFLFTKLTVVFSVVILLSLYLFTNLDERVLRSISLILIFLILFTFIFKTRGMAILNFVIIVFSFIALPIFLLFYLNIFSSLPGVIGGIRMVGITVLCGILAIATMIWINMVEVRFSVFKK